MPRSRRHYRVTLGDALFAHERALEAGGRPGVRSSDDLQSALGRPYSGYHRTLPRKAAALFEAVATGHAFTDGNKRTAILLADLLIVQSGKALVPATAGEDLGEAFEQLALDVVEHRTMFDEIADWFAARIAPQSDLTSL